MQDLRVVDSAIEQYAIETNKTTGADTNWTDISKYLKTGSTLQASGGKDMLGNLINAGSFSVDRIPKVASVTFDKLSDVAPAEFWSPFK